MKRTIFAVCSCIFILSACQIDQSKRQVKILILGNSITHHPPSKDLGWYGNWGMAASSRENDFVHQLIKMITIEYPDNAINYKIQNIATWERDFTVNLSTFRKIAKYKPDLLIIRLGENVPDDYAESNDYYTALTELINYYKDLNTKVIITSNFWVDGYKDNIQKSVALDNNYHFVDLSGLLQDQTNTSIGLYANSAVAGHPSDKGMYNIANLIFNCIRDNGLIN